MPRSQKNVNSIVIRQNLRQILKEQRISQTLLLERIKKINPENTLVKSRISDILNAEKDKIKLYYDDLANIANALNLSIDEIQKNAVNGALINNCNHLQFGNRNQMSIQDGSELTDSERQLYLNTIEDLKKERDAARAKYEKIVEKIIDSKFQ